MSETTAVGPVEVIRARMPKLRHQRGMTAAQLGEAMAAVGVPWDRSIVANFESGRRETVSVVELWALARVLDVSPVALAVPLDDEQPYLVTPGQTEPSKAVRAWVAGRAPLPGMNAAWFWAEAPEGEAAAFMPTMPLSETVAELAQEVRELRQEVRYVDFQGVGRPARPPKEGRDDG